MYLPDQARLVGFFRHCPGDQLILVPKGPHQIFLHVSEWSFYFLRSEPICAYNYVYKRYVLLSTSEVSTLARIKKEIMMPVLFSVAGTRLDVSTSTDCKTFERGSRIVIEQDGEVSLLDYEKWENMLYVAESIGGIFFQNVFGKEPRS